MNGLQHTNIQQNGQMLIKLLITMLIISIALSSCSAEWWLGDGRGDWTLDLFEGYRIAKINSREIILVRKMFPNDSGGAHVLPNYFFIIAYQLHEPYICLEGISTERKYISDDELNAMVLSYYIVNTTNDEIIGPIESDCFLERCNSLGLDVQNKWIKLSENHP